MPIGSGRTASGVHANAQVIHVELPPFWSDLLLLKEQLNRHLQPHMYIKKIWQVSPNSHARFSAKKRVYRYIIYKGIFSPFIAPYVTFYNKNLSLETINKALAEFVGVHDFSLFKKNGSETKHNIREIYKAFAYNKGDFTIIHVCGSGFLRSQIRMMIYAILSYNENKIELKNLKEQIANKHQTTKGLAPANGLYLAKIIY